MKMSAIHVRALALNALQNLSVQSATLYSPIFGTANVFVEKMLDGRILRINSFFKTNAIVRKILFKTKTGVCPALTSYQDVCNV